MNKKVDNFFRGVYEIIWGPPKPISPATYREYHRYEIPHMMHRLTTGTGSYKQLDELYRDLRKLDERARESFSPSELIIWEKRFAFLEKLYDEYCKNSYKVLEEK